MLSRTHVAALTPHGLGASRHHQELAIDCKKNTN
jgi:hypothetical protein